MGRNEEEAVREFKRMCGVANWYAQDVLWCLRYIQASPPPDLIRMMQAHGYIRLAAAKKSDEKNADLRQQYLDWLGHWIDVLQRVSDENNNQCK